MRIVQVLFLPYIPMNVCRCFDNLLHPFLIFLAKYKQMKGDFSLGHNIVSWPLLQIDMTTKISLVLMNQAF